MRATKNLPVIFVVALLTACSGAEEQVQIETPVINMAEIAQPEVDTRVFKYNDRYYVKGATLALSTKVDDPVQALRVIQLAEGAHEALVISSFENDGPAPTETWLGLEFDTITLGRYNLEDAEALQFYRFYLGEQRSRFDGEKASGVVTFTELTNQAVYGMIDALIIGFTKAFDTASKPDTVRFSGSFRLARVNLEDTMIGGR